MKTSNGCSWTTTTKTSWITITSGGSGSGNGTVAYTVTPNTNTRQRTGKMTIAKQTFTVTQAGAGSSCAYSISPKSQDFNSAGGTGSVGVTAQSGCNWTAASNAGWMTITSGASGNGTGSVGYSVSANTVASQRTGTMTIAGQSFTVTQSGAGPSCTYSISTTNQNFDPTGGTGSVGVTAQSGCNWTAASNAGWMTITSGASGSGNGSVGYSVSVNTNTSQRTGTMTIAGQTFTVSQSPCPVSRNAFRPFSFKRHHECVDQPDIELGSRFEYGVLWYLFGDILQSALRRQYDGHELSSLRANLRYRLLLESRGQE